MIIDTCDQCETFIEIGDLNDGDILKCGMCGRVHQLCDDGETIWLEGASDQLEQIYGLMYIHLKFNIPTPEDLDTAFRRTAYREREYDE